jgi:hypothetical protein
VSLEQIESEVVIVQVDDCRVRQSGPWNACTMATSEPWYESDTSESQSPASVYPGCLTSQNQAMGISLDAMSRCTGNLRSVRDSRNHLVGSRNFVRVGGAVNVQRCMQRLARTR